jgi:hypothetical protein
MTPFVSRLMRTALIASTVAVAPAAALAGETPEQGAIHKLLNDTFDKPETRLVVDPIVVEDTYAVADWTQGEMGGRALLRKTGSVWVLILCSGDGLKSADLLKRTGASETVALKLSAGLAAAEAALDKARLAQLSRFDGVMYMDADAKNRAEGK